LNEKTCHYIFSVDEANGNNFKNSRFCYIPHFHVVLNSLFYFHQTFQVAISRGWNAD